MEAGVTVMNNLKQNDFISMNNLGEELRKQLRSVFDEIDLPVQVTGYASLFGINFNENKITDYRSFIKNNSDIAKVFFAYLRNKGILLQVKNAGALNTLMTTNEIDFLVDSAREIAIQIKEAVY